MRLRTKILLLSTSGILLTGMAVVAVGLRQGSVLDKQVGHEMDTLARAESSKIAKDVYLMLRTQHETLGKRLMSDLAVARELLQRDGGISFATDTAPWKAINQFSNEAREVALPKMLLGGKWLGQNTDSNVPSLLVD